MFKKSLLEGSPTDPPVVGKIVFNGYAEVRQSPQNQPPFLKQRIRMGKDVIAIWFKHTHAERFKDMDEWLGIKIISEASKGQNLLPTINDMSTEEILEFCKSIDVHPAHLVPWDTDRHLSLPTPLLELLIEMAYEDVSGKKYDLNDVYLAKAAIAYECNRIRLDLANDRKIAFKNNDRLSLLAQIFTEVLSDPKLAKDISKTTIVTPSQNFAAAANRSYPYVERVHDIAVIQTEMAIEQSSHTMKVKKDILHWRTGSYQKTYHTLFGAGDMEARDFLSDVRERFEDGLMLQRTPQLGEVAVIVSELLDTQKPYNKAYEAANNKYIERFGKLSHESSEDDERYLREVEHTQFHDLCVSIQQVFDSECHLMKSKRKHEEREGEYILNVGKIRQAFDKVEDGYQYNLLNNRVLLTLHNIGIQEKIVPQTSPK